MSIIICGTPRSSQTWGGFDAQTRQRLEEAGWKAPRFQGEPGAGLDFLGMHRQMIAEANALLQAAGVAGWARVSGWDPIPWAVDDADWPTPALWAEANEGIRWAKDAARLPEMQKLADRYRAVGYLRKRSLDILGSDIENTIHNWMHLRWAEKPVTEPFDLSAANDNLAQPWSSHVNRHFWKLHGWIDECVGAWAAANGAVADLSAGWSGPHDHIVAFDKAAPRLVVVAEEISAPPLKFDAEIARRALAD